MNRKFLHTCTATNHRKSDYITNNTGEVMAILEAVTYINTTLSGKTV